MAKILAKYGMASTARAINCIWCKATKRRGASNGPVVLAGADGVSFFSNKLHPFKKVDPVLQPLLNKSLQIPWFT